MENVVIKLFQKSTGELCNTGNLDKEPTWSNTYRLALQLIQKIGFAETVPMEVEEGLVFGFALLSRTGVYI